jgi:hypothetical protein
MNHPCFATMNHSTLRAHFRFIESDSSNSAGALFCENVVAHIGACFYACELASLFGPILHPVRSLQRNYLAHSCFLAGTSSTELHSSTVQTLG